MPTPLTRTLLVALAYAALGFATLQVATPGGTHAPLFAPAGIALAAAYAWGAVALAGIALGALLTHALLHAVGGAVAPLAQAVAAAMLLGALLQAWLGAHALRRISPQALPLDHPQDVLRAALGVGLGISLINATAVSLTRLALDDVPALGLPAFWLNWWIGDALGVMVGAPIALAWIGTPQALWRARRATVAWPLLGLLAVMALVIQQIRSAEDARLRSEFDASAGEAYAALSVQLTSYLHALRAMQGVYEASDTVTAEEFEAAAAPWLADLPQLRAIGEYTRVRHAELARFEQQRRAAGMPGFAVFDRGPGGEQQPPAAAPEYRVLTRIAPLANNERALGLNAASVPVVAAAIATALRSGRPAGTEGFTLTQDQEPAGPGVVVYGVPRPGGKHAAAGEHVLFVTLRIDAAVTGAIDTHRLHGLRLCLVDASPDAGDRVLYGTAGCDRVPGTALRHAASLAFAQRLWTLHVEPQPDWFDARRSWGAWYGAVVGLVAVAAIGGFLLLLTGRKQRVEDQVALRTTELAREVAERRAALRALHESEQLLRDIFAAAPIGIAHSNLEHRFVRVNPRMCEITGYSEEELCRLSVRDITPQRYWEEDMRVRQALRDGTVSRAARRVKEYVRKDGSTVPVEVTVTMLRDAEGQPVNYVAVVEDITERLGRAEAVRAREVAEEANRAKSDFMSRMSHELRTPLNAMIGFAQVLDLDRSGPLTPSQRERVGEIQKAGWHLLAMINDVLDLSRIESGALRLEMGAVDLPAVVRDCERMLEAERNRRRLGFELAFAPDARWVRGDATRVKQVLTNLLSNAIKYNREGGTVRLATQRGDDDRIRITVTDTGIGMDQSQLDQLFVPFNRLGRENRVEGTGIGLVIARHLVELMEGDIAVSSRPGAGSTFDVWLQPSAPPAADAAPAAAGNGPAPATAASDVGRRRVLCIEDNPVNAALLRQALALRPAVAARICATAAEGLAAARVWQPEVILLDMNLPDEPGLEVLAQLKRDDELARIPVLVVSADALPRQINAALALGALGYLTKPLQLPELLERVDALLQPGGR